MTSVGKGTFIKKEMVPDVYYNRIVNYIKLNNITATAEEFASKQTPSIARISVTPLRRSPSEGEEMLAKLL